MCTSDWVFSESFNSSPPEIHLGTHTSLLKDGFSWIWNKVSDQKKERIIDGSGVFRAPGNHLRSIQVSILLLKGNFNVNLPGEHFSYCLMWDGWDFTKRASQSFNCILTLCRTSFGCLKELLWHERAFLKTGTGPCSCPLLSSPLLPQQSEQKQEQAYSLMPIRLSE